MHWLTVRSVGVGRPTVCPEGAVATLVTKQNDRIPVAELPEDQQRRIKHEGGEYFYGAVWYLKKALSTHPGNSIGWVDNLLTTGNDRDGCLVFTRADTGTRVTIRHDNVAYVESDHA